MQRTVINEAGAFKLQFCACDAYKDRYIIIAGGFQSNFIHGVFDGLFLESAHMLDVATHSRIALPNLPTVGICNGVIINDHFYMAIHCEIFRLNLSRRQGWEVVRTRMEYKINSMMTDGNHLFFYRMDGLCRYDPMTDELNFISSMPDQIRFSSMLTGILVDNKIHFIDTTMNMNFHLVFDIVTETWSQAPVIPKPFKYISIYRIDRWIVMTGEPQGKYNLSAQTFVFDTLTERWGEYDIAHSSSCGGHSWVGIGSQLISVGGVDKRNNFLPIEAISIKHLTDYWNWEIIKDIILLRELIDQNRGFPVNLTKRRKEKDDFKLDVDILIQKFLTDMPLDIFRDVISFLI